MPGHTGGDEILSPCEQQKADLMKRLNQVQASHNERALECETLGTSVLDWYATLGETPAPEATEFVTRLGFSENTDPTQRPPDFPLPRTGGLAKAWQDIQDRINAIKDRINAIDCSNDNTWAALAAEIENDLDAVQTASTNWQNDLVNWRAEWELYCATNG